MLEVKISSRFKTSYKRASKHKNFKQEVFDFVVLMLSSEIELPKKFKDHSLIGNHSDSRECHLAPDLLLIYKIENDKIYLELLDIGTHSGLFGK